MGIHCHESSCYLEFQTIFSPLFTSCANAIVRLRCLSDVDGKINQMKRNKYSCSWRMWKVLTCWKEEGQCDVKWGLINSCRQNLFKAEESSAASCHPSNWIPKSLPVSTRCQSPLNFGNWESWLIYFFCFLFLRAVGSKYIILTEGERKK